MDNISRLLFQVTELFALLTHPDFALLNSTVLEVWMHLSTQYNLSTLLGHSFLEFYTNAFQERQQKEQVKQNN